MAERQAENALSFGLNLDKTAFRAGLQEGGFGGG